MADTLYLSLWYPNLRLEALPDKLAAVLGAFAEHGGERGVYAATVWPVSWSEPPVFQEVWGRRTIAGGEGETQLGAEPAAAVEAATELLHEDYAYEFQIGWSLWEAETAPGQAGPFHGGHALDTAPVPPTDRYDAAMNGAQPAQDEHPVQDDRPIRRWARGPRLVRVTGYGPLFDEGAYEQDGHIRLDLGPDGPFLEEDVELDVAGARHVEENVRQLIELASAIEKASGATARLLWSELGASLARRLTARLGAGN